MESLSTAIETDSFNPDLIESGYDDFESGILFENENYGTDENTLSNEPYVGPEWKVSDKHFGYVDNNVLFLNGEAQTFGGAEAIISSLYEHGSYDSKFTDVQKQVECLARYSIENGLVTLTIYESGPSGVIEDAPEKPESNFEKFEDFYENGETSFDNLDFQNENNVATHESRAERGTEALHYSVEPATYVETSSQFQKEARQIAADTGIQIVFDSPASQDADPIIPERAKIITESQTIN